MKDKSQEFSQQVNIKSKYLSSQESRNIIVSPHKEQISISQSGTPQQFKQFHIDQLNSTETQGNTVFLEFDNGRRYEVESDRPEHLNQALKHTKNLQMSNKFVEQSIPQLGNSINYCQAMTPLLSLINQPNLTSPKNQGLTNQKQSYQTTSIAKAKVKKQIIQREYKCRPFFIDPANWRVTRTEGDLIILNQEWKNNASKIVGFLVKKFLTSGSFMGLSFPVFAMKPESILQTYAKSISAAPKIFSKTLDSVQRMKQFISFIWTVSIQHVTLLKPFNPVIGQTFQADIAGGSFSAEQVSHHPPISAFYYIKDNYKIYASLEMTASIGMNSGEGRFNGDITIQYDDGHWIKGRLTNGQMVGVMVGQMKFCAFGGSYVYDSQGLVLTYQLDKQNNHNFEGFLGTLKHKASKNFEKILKDENRFARFKPYTRDDYSKVFGRFLAKYASWVAFDGKQFFNVKDQKMNPFQLELPQQPLLKSDSRYRKDLQFLKNKQIDASQQEKERIEDIQRANRKLREKYGKKK